MTIKYVDIVRSEGDRNVLLARCIWREGTPVEVRGEGNLVAELRFGVEDFDGSMKTPDDGEAFLNAVRYAFRTPYLLATSMQEGEPSATTFG